MAKKRKATSSDEVATKLVEITRVEKLDDGKRRCTFSPVITTSARRRQAAQGNPIGNQVFTEDLDPEEVGEIAIDQRFNLVLVRADEAASEVEDEDEAEEE